MPVFNNALKVRKSLDSVFDDVCCYPLSQSIHTTLNELLQTEQLVELLVRFNSEI